MNKTTMTLAAALALGASAFAATPQEMVAAKDWEALSMCGFAAITNYMPKANAADVYAACLATNVNYWKAADLVLLGYTASPEQCYNDLKAKWPMREAFGSAWKIASNGKVNNHVWQLEIAEKASKAGTCSETFALQALVFDKKLLTDESEFLRIASEALARDDFLTACAPIAYWVCQKGTFNTDETDAVKAWRDANAEAVMTGLASKEMTSGVVSYWRSCIFNLSKRDLGAKDHSNSYAMRFFNQKFFNAKYGNLLYGDSYLTRYAFGTAQLEAYMKNSDDAKLMYSHLMKRVGRNYYKKDRVEIFKKYFEKFATDPNTAFKVALDINDTDKMLDALVASTADLTPEDITTIIEKVVTFDADYRTADVVKILKNINAKYTLKLYDDRDTWEPILSKVRALIDTRL